MRAFQQPPQGPDQIHGHRRCHHEADGQGSGQQYDTVSYGTVLLRDRVAHRLIEQAEHLAPDPLALGVEGIARVVERAEEIAKPSLIVIRERTFDLAAQLLITRMIALEEIEACIQPAQQHLVAEPGAVLDRRGDDPAGGEDFVVGFLRLLLHQGSQPRDLGSVNGGFETDDRQTTQIGGLLERANMSSCKRRVARHVGLFDIG